MRHGNFTKSAATVAGFTLLELLVSSAMIGVIMMIMLMATSTSMAIWRNSERAIAVDREGRNAMTLISDDFANMLPVSEDAPDYLQPRLAVWKDLVFAEFLVLRPRDYQTEGAGNDGDVCYVRYRYKDNKIERAVADSAATFAALENKKAPVTADYEVVSQGLPGFRISAFDELGVDINPEADPQEIKRVRFVGMSLDALDEEEAKNREEGVSLRQDGTSSEVLSSIQYFQAFFRVPRS